MEKLPFSALRAIKKMSQKEVADAVGVNRATYASWERYDTYPDALQLIKLAEIFECSMDTFYFPERAS